jgi:hypothetical protein
MFENAVEIVFFKNLNFFKLNFFMLPDQFDISCQKYFLKNIILMRFRTKSTFKISTTLVQLRQCLKTLLKLCFLKKLIFLYFQIVLIRQKYFFKKIIILIHFQIKNTLNQNHYLDSGCPRFQNILKKNCLK